MIRTDTATTGHVCEIYTARIDSRDPDRLDITVKSANTSEGKSLAPTWELVTSHKDGRINDAQYTERYLTLLRGRYARTPEEFEETLARRRVVLVCYCKAGSFCHRHLAAEVLQKIGISLGITVYLCGEMEPKPKKRRIKRNIEEETDAAPDFADLRRQYIESAWATMYAQKPITACRRDFYAQMQPLRSLCLAMGVPHPHDYGWQSVKRCSRSIDNPFISDLWG
jgi:uncharacterized protein YeaO (DUF488 family)